MKKLEQWLGGGHSNFDVIYIDPPYNTESAKTDGNVSANNNENISASKFIYRDKFSRNGWLNMMKERLVMARQLLKEDGVIFVSIDDNEQAYLKVLMDEIFGEKNFVCNFIWRNKNTGGGSDKLRIDIESEYILCYSKNIKAISINAKSIDPENYQYEDEYLNTRGKYNLTDLDRVSSKSSFQYIESLDYLIKAPDGTMFKNYRNIIKPKSYSYTLGKDLFNFANENGFIFYKKIKINGNEYWKAYRKSYEKVIISRNYPYKIIDREKGNNFNNLIGFNESISTSLGKKMLINILDNKDFPFPKPTKLLEYLININPNKSARVLDFFAGSGTTGHAVLELNREDGGSRTYTLVTNDENNIGSNVTYERLYRINNGKGTKGETDFKWLEKNEPYKQNLNVYNIEYFDASINNPEKDESDDISLKLLKKLDDLLNSFNLKSIGINSQEKINILTELNALDKKEITNESK